MFSPFAQVAPTLAGDPDPLVFLKLLYNSIHAGQWPEVGAVILIVIVAGLRKYGAALHEKIPDTNPLDAVFFFFLETAFGCWLLNILTAIAGGIGSALLVGQPLTFALAKSVLAVSLTGAALYQGAKDFLTWRRVATEKAEAEKQAKLALVTPPAS